MLLKITPIGPRMTAEKKAAQISFLQVSQLEDLLWINQITSSSNLLHGETHVCNILKANCNKCGYDWGAFTNYVCIFWHLIKYVPP